MNYRIEKGTTGLLITATKRGDQVVLNYEDWATRQTLHFEAKHLVTNPNEKRGTAVPKFAANLAKKGNFVFKQVNVVENNMIYFLAIHGGQVIRTAT